MDLFDLEDDLPVPSKECLTIPVYRSIFKKDSRYSKKTYIVKGVTELSYVYFMEDYRSPYAKNYSHKERESVVRKRLMIPKEWEEDELVVEARKFYRADQQTAETKALNEVKEALYTTSNVVKMMRDKINTAVDDQENLNADKIKEMMSMLDNILSVSDKLPKAIESIKKLEEEVKRQLSTISGKAKKRNVFEV